jgi:hypothetical protein
MPKGSIPFTKKRAGLTTRLEERRRKPMKSNNSIHVLILHGKAGAVFMKLASLAYTFPGKMLGELMEGK